MLPRGLLAAAAPLLQTPSLSSKPKESHAYSTVPEGNFIVAVSPLQTEG